MKKEVRDVNDRVGTLGCSDIGAVYDASTYRTSRDVALAYRGEAPAPTEEQELAFQMGHLLEPMVAELIKSLYGMKLKGSKFRYLCAEEPRLGCHPDRLVIGDNSTAVEIKTSSAFDNARWGEEDTDEIPYDYLLQCYGYFICLKNIKRVYLFRFSNNRLTRYTINRPEETVLKGIVSYLTEWMNKVESGWMPNPKTYAEAVKVWKPTEGSAEATEEIKTKLGQILFYTAAESEAKKKKEDLKAEVVNYLNDNKVNALYDGAGVNLCNYGLVKKSSIDTDMLSEKYPNIAEECSKDASYNQLRVSKPKKAKE